MGTWESLQQMRCRLPDMKFGRDGLEISWDLTGTYTEDFKSDLEQEFEWICRRATKTF